MIKASENIIKWFGQDNSTKRDLSLLVQASIAESGTAIKEDDLFVPLDVNEDGSIDENFEHFYIGRGIAAEYFSKKALALRTENGEVKSPTNQAILKEVGVLTQDTENPQEVKVAPNYSVRIGNEEGKAVVETKTENRTEVSVSPQIEAGTVINPQSVAAAKETPKPLPAVTYAPKVEPTPETDEANTSRNTNPPTNPNNSNVRIPSSNPNNQRQVVSPTATVAPKNPDTQNTTKDEIEKKIGELGVKINVTWQEVDKETSIAGKKNKIKELRDLITEFEKYINDNSANIDTEKKTALITGINNLTKELEALEDNINKLANSSDKVIKLLEDGIKDTEKIIKSNETNSLNPFDYLASWTSGNGRLNEPLKELIKKIEDIKAKLKDNRIDVAQALKDYNTALGKSTENAEKLAKEVSDSAIVGARVTTAVIALSVIASGGTAAAIAVPGLTVVAGGAVATTAIAGTVWAPIATTGLTLAGAAGIGGTTSVAVNTATRSVSYTPIYNDQSRSTYKEIFKKEAGVTWENTGDAFRDGFFAGAMGGGNVLAATRLVKAGFSATIAAAITGTGSGIIQSIPTIVDPNISWDRKLMTTGLTIAGNTWAGWAGAKFPIEGTLKQQLFNFTSQGVSQATFDILIAYANDGTITPEEIPQIISGILSSGVGGNQAHQTAQTNIPNRYLGKPVDELKTRQAELKAEIKRLKNSGEKNARNEAIAELIKVNEALTSFPPGFNPYEAVKEFIANKKKPPELSQEEIKARLDNIDNSNRYKEVPKEELQAIKEEIETELAKDDIRPNIRTQLEKQLSLVKEVLAAHGITDVPPPRIPVPPPESEQQLQQDLEALPSDNTFKTAKKEDLIESRKFYEEALKKDIPKNQKEELQRYIDQIDQVLKVHDNYAQKPKGWGPSAIDKGKDFWNSIQIKQREAKLKELRKQNNPFLDTEPTLLLAERKLREDLLYEAIYHDSGTSWSNRARARAELKQIEEVLSARGIEVPDKRSRSLFDKVARPHYEKLFAFIESKPGLRNLVGNLKNNRVTRSVGAQWNEVIGKPWNDYWQGLEANRVKQIQQDLSELKEKYPNTNFFEDRIVTLLNRKDHHEKLLANNLSDEHRVKLEAEIQQINEALAIHGKDGLKAEKKALEQDLSQAKKDGNTYLQKGIEEIYIPLVNKGLEAYEGKLPKIGRAIKDKALGLRYSKSITVRMVPVQKLLKEIVELPISDKKYQKKLADKSAQVDKLLNKLVKEFGDENIINYLDSRINELNTSTEANKMRKIQHYEELKTKATEIQTKLNSEPSFRERVKSIPGGLKNGFAIISARQSVYKLLDKNLIQADNAESKLSELLKSHEPQVLKKAIETIKEDVSGWAPGDDKTKLQNQLDLLEAQLNKNPLLNLMLDLMLGGKRINLENGIEYKVVPNPVDPQWQDLSFGKSSQKLSIYYIGRFDLESGTLSSPKFKVYDSEGKLLNDPTKQFISLSKDGIYFTHALNDENTIYRIAVNDNDIEITKANELPNAKPPMAKMREVDIANAINQNLQGRNVTVQVRRKDPDSDSQGLHVLISRPDGSNVNYQEIFNVVKQTIDGLPTDRGEQLIVYGRLAGARSPEWQKFETIDLETPQSKTTKTQTIDFNHGGIREVKIQDGIKVSTRIDGEWKDIILDSFGPIGIRNNGEIIIENSAGLYNSAIITDQNGNYLPPVGGRNYDLKKNAIYYVQNSSNEYFEVKIGSDNIEINKTDPSKIPARNNNALTFNVGEYKTQVDNQINLRIDGGDNYKEFSLGLLDKGVLVQKDGTIKFIDSNKSQDSKIFFSDGTELPIDTPIETGKTYYIQSNANPSEKYKVERKEKEVTISRSTDDLPAPKAKVDLPQLKTNELVNLTKSTDAANPIWHRVDGSDLEVQWADGKITLRSEDAKIEVQKTRDLSGIPNTPAQIKTSTTQQLPEDFFGIVDVTKPGQETSTYTIAANGKDGKFVVAKAGTAFPDEVFDWYHGSILQTRSLEITGLRPTHEIALIQDTPLFVRLEKVRDKLQFRLAPAIGYSYSIIKVENNTKQSLSPVVFFDQNQIVKPSDETKIYIEVSAPDKTKKTYQVESMDTSNGDIKLKEVTVVDVPPAPPKQKITLNTADDVAKQFNADPSTLKGGISVSPDPQNSRNDIKVQAETKNNTEMSLIEMTSGDFALVPVNSKGFNLREFNSFFGEWKTGMDIYDFEVYTGNRKSTFDELLTELIKTHPDNVPLHELDRENYIKGTDGKYSWDPMTKEQAEEALLPALVYKLIRDSIAKSPENTNMIQPAIFKKDGDKYTLVSKGKMVVDISTPVQPSKNPPKP